MIMKKITITLLLVFLALLGFSQTNTDILGEWYNVKKDVIITLYEEKETVSGKITWMKFPNYDDGNPKTDPFNADEKLKSRARMGMIVMYDLTYIAGNIWDNGSLYIAAEGKTYSGMMRLKNENTLNIRGYVGFSIFERYSSTWTRVLARDKFRNNILEKESLLTQLGLDLMEIIKLIENISLKPAEEILQKIENENLLIMLKLDLSKIIEKIEKIKKAK
jgi:uncharacterized protein (DUF2147 family)